MADVVVDLEQLWNTHKDALMPLIKGSLIVWNVWGGKDDPKFITDLAMHYVNHTGYRKKKHNFTLTDAENIHYIKKYLAITTNNDEESDGYNHKIHEFRLIGNGTTELTYMDTLSNHTYTIPIKFAQLHFNIDIEKNNKCYTQYL